LFAHEVARARSRGDARGAVAVAAVGADDADLSRLRFAVWLLGFATLGAVAIGISHERRLTRRVAERSAELERLSGELIQVNRTKSEFLANVSHELRTPLNAIVGFVDLLHEGVYGPLSPRQQAPVQRLASSAAHLRQLVDQILDLAKISAGRLDVSTEVIDLRPFVLDVATELEPLVQAKELALSLGVPATLPRVRTDPVHLRQILVNLLGNAVKFTPEGRISVRAQVGRRRDEADDEARPPAERLARLLPAIPGLPALAGMRRRPEPGEVDPDWVALQVIDTGIGIPAEEHERIFDEFEQIGPRTGDSAVRGTGLGLAISRRLARLLGGDLTVESAPGQGTTFTVWLRAVERRTPAVSTPVVEGAAAGAPAASPGADVSA
ncbi:HAMP domain-containing sensor histidine kinase, partial [Roseisolibacter sp. H3M3-2]|uniref:sensor histidine kinase n=1 Tax=Roseisolibacter sp. H3M3-2 TaxID=3031323 RepID=UPI0023D9A40D